MRMSFKDDAGRFATAKTLVESPCDLRVWCTVCKAYTTAGRARLCPEVWLKLKQYSIIVRKYSPKTPESDQTQGCGCSEKGEP